MFEFGLIVVAVVLAVVFHDRLIGGLHMLKDYVLGMFKKD